MEDKDELKKKITLFRNKLKEYRAVWLKILKREYGTLAQETEESLFKKEEEIREELTEDWGRLRKVFHDLGVCIMTVTPAIGLKNYIFEEALSGKLFNNPLKGDSLLNAISSATQAIGEVDSLTDIGFKQLTQKTPILFFAHSFREKKEKLVTNIKKFLESYPVSITTGEKPTTEGVSEKVKKLITDSDYVLVVLTKDEQQKDETWQPSKWLYDELAFALGKDKTVITFLEEGINYKPAIFGDFEYILFKEDLTDAFIKLSHLFNTFLK